VEFDSSVTMFNYRWERIGNMKRRALPTTDGAVMENTNGQVKREGDYLWFNVYHRENDLGFHPDMIAAVVHSLTGLEEVRRFIRMACLFADCHAWKIHHYSDSPIEQAIDILSALVSLYSEIDAAAPLATEEAVEVK